KGGFDPVPLKKDKSASKHSHKHNH
ncbi:TPA: membrane protein insertion efficiency factor YidD, partial [Staphylococcus aureus]|nr:membrane protein insertion efficiency factor YidD [Staphylococcus aureus]